MNEQEGLKPGMSVAVEVFLAEHNDVLTIPVAAVVEQNQTYMCWVETAQGVAKRTLKLGDSNERFVVVEEGLQEGDLVVLNPIDFVEEAQSNALKPTNGNKSDKAFESKEKSKNAPADSAKASATKEAVKPKAKRPNGAEVLKKGDKNGDGVLTKDEFDEKTKPYFDSMDTDANGEVNAAEIDASLKRISQAAPEK